MSLTPSDAAMSLARPLRILTLVTSALAAPLLIATTVVSVTVARSAYHHRSVTVWCFGYIPLALTALSSYLDLARQNKTHGQAPHGRFFVLDGLATIVYLGILIPIWAIEVRAMGKPGFGLLAGYTTAPMIVNLFVHGYLFCTAPAARLLFRWEQVHECPNCHSSFSTRALKVQETAKGGEGYSLLRGEEYLDVDADAEHYTDARTGALDEQMRAEGESKGEVKKTMVDV